MSNIPNGLKFAKSHEWIRLKGGVGTVGITDHAQNELTDIVFVELPEVGKELTAGTVCAVVESVKSASDIYAPASGEVVEVNSVLIDNPERVNNDPYGEGWFFKLRITVEVEGLFDAAGYSSEIGES